MFDTMQVGVRHRNGLMNILHVNGCADWDEARKYVLEQVATAAVVLVLIPGEARRAVMKVAA